jgi:hypothetical protein
VQKELVQQMADSPLKAKILGIHVPPVSPWDHWTDDDLARGRVRVTGRDFKAIWGGKMYDGTDAEREESLHRLRGADFDVFQVTDMLKQNKTPPDGEYPTLAIRLTKDELYGRDANYSSLTQEREWLVKTVRQAKFSLVLAGHIHRRGVLIIDDSGGSDLPAGSRGKWVVRAIPAQQAPKAQTPLFVNSTSTGPLGHVFAWRGKYFSAESAYTAVAIDANGAVDLVEFRPDTNRVPVAANDSAPASPGKTGSKVPSGVA